MSEVINWLSRSKGPEAVVIYADFYDYDLNTNIFKLPEEKEGVLKLINSLIDELELNRLDDILFRLDLSPPDRNKSDQTFENMRTQVSNNRIEWTFEEIEEKGLDQWAYIVEVLPPNVNPVLVCFSTGFTSFDVEVLLPPNNLRYLEIKT